MKFRRRQVADQAAQENFDQLQTMFPLGVSDLATGILLQLAATGTARKIAFGTATWTWPGGALGSTPQTVTHGLGGAPVVVWAFPIAGPQGNALSGVAYTYTTTQFTTHGIFASFSPAAAATAPFGWVAVG